MGLNTFDTPPFDYAPEALAGIFAALRDERGRIETSTLQIVCRYVEDRVAAGEMPGRTVTAADMGDIKTIFREFYERTIAGLPQSEQAPARRLVEDLLIRNGTRIPYAAQALLDQPGITQALLDRLAEASLLRVERDERGRMLYEVGHDTLVGPIGEAAQLRRAQEENERLQRLADEQRREKEAALAERRRARLVAAGAIVLSLLAIAASFEAWRQTLKAGVEAENARQKQSLADSSARVALLQENRAHASADTARLREQQARVAEQKAGEALRLANDNAGVAVGVLLQQANNSIYHLDYGAALTALNAAAKLGRQKRDVAKGLYELAFFYAESGDLFNAQNTISAAGALTGQPTNPGQNATALRAALKTMDAGWYRAMTERYFPVMTDIPGGAFTMGCIRPEDCANDSTPYRVRLNDYQLARTETTFWQWGLYCAAKGLKLRDLSPSWGIDGDNPAVNVDWFHATEYANWLSARFEKPPVYQIDSLGKERRSAWIVTIIPGAAEKGGYRLPTEAEWEYAARGGPKHYPYRYAGGDTLSEVAWFIDNSDTLGVQRTHPVATRKALILSEKNRLFDMSGNVWEWCWDWYDEYPAKTTEPVTNPYGPPEGNSRVLRGGSWYGVEDFCGPGLRIRSYPFVRLDYWGFRLARL